ncbi:hypothetical protein P4B35_03765, partial [Pontiellaceae bacterium B12227]|nr:hypothetical protein [Pontiellaceae bacterium B12227]
MEWFGGRGFIRAAATSLFQPLETARRTNGADLRGICSAWSRQDACDTARTAAILAATRSPLEAGD